MSPQQAIAPAFFIIGAQKSGTTWLWAMLNQHPGTSLPTEKEIHYFGSSELYAKGDDWYLRHFDGLDACKLIGEASTTYFYNRVPYWHNASHELQHDDTLPTIPELILKRYPDARFIVVLRDPVYRAISAYLQWMKQGKLSPVLGLVNIACNYPKMRILKYGYYARYLELWQRFVDPDRFRIVIFEDQIKKNPKQLLTELYRFLDLDQSFKPALPQRAVHKSWTWTRIVFNYYAGKICPGAGNTFLGRLCGRFDVMAKAAVSPREIEFLRSIYLPEKDKLQALTGNPLTSWDYGERLLQ
jgi:hypothetical protein